MKKNKALIGSALALLIAPTVLSNLSPQTVSAADTTEIGLVGTVSGSGVLVDDSGQTITSTFLPNNSSWKLGNTKQINGVTYYQVATNEWIAANNLNVSNTAAQAQTQTATQPETQSYASQINSGKTGTVKYATSVVNSQGQAVSGVILPAGSSWTVGTVVTLNGASYVQIATDEYVAESNLYITESANDQTAAAQSPQEQTAQTPQQQVVGTVVNGPANVYDTSMNSFSGRQLEEGSQWKVGQMVQNKYGYTFYQVSNNEWTQSSNMQLNQADASNNVTSEPEFATSVTQ